jgi:hypothetical protein
VFDHTVRTLVDRVKPDLITITGDLSMADQPKAYPQLADYMDAFGIPWCAVWGNHEEQDVTKWVNFVYEFLPYYRSKNHFFHEDGDPALGNGNYLIAIQKDGQPVHTLFMVDSHNCVWLPDETGVKHFYYDKLNEAQIQWYKEQCTMLKDLGCKYVIARATRDVHKKLLLRNGADYVVYAEREIAERLAIKFGADNIFDYIELTPEIGIYEVALPKEWLGRSIMELSIRNKYHVSILATKKNEQIYPLPSPHHIFENDESVMVMGTAEAIKAIT